MRLTEPLTKEGEQFLRGLGRVEHASARAMEVVKVGRTS